MYYPRLRRQKNFFLKAYHSSWLQYNRLGVDAQTAKGIFPGELESYDPLPIVMI
jgi:hypothetical protein